MNKPAQRMLHYRLRPTIECKKNDTVTNLPTILCIVSALFAMLSAVAALLKKS